MLEPNHRILLVDDNPAIHEDFRKVLIGNGQEDAAFDDAEAQLFGEFPIVAPATVFEITSAFQGKEALEKVLDAAQIGRPFAMAFIDVRMPPGWDGIQTIEHLWRVAPSLQVVICTAYSDYSWEKMTARLGLSDKLVMLKKPFENIEVLQLAHALTCKWNVTRQADLRFSELNRLVAERTAHLQISEERFGKVFHASPVALALQTLETERFVEVNTAFAELTGTARQDLLGRTPEEAGARFDLPPPLLADRRAGRVIRNAEVEFTNRDGQMSSILLSLENLTIAGEPHLLLMAQDISARLRLESQLRHSQKMEAVGQLSAGIAHDFNNLLTIIEGHASLQLSMPDVPGDLADSLQQIEQAADRAATLTRQLLAFSRRQVMRPRVLNLNDLIANLSAMLRRLIGENLALAWHLPAELPCVCADPASIEQIIMNLMLNAREAIHLSGEITIATQAVTLRVEDCPPTSEARPGEFICLSVSDTGIGMDAKMIAHIFEPFFSTKDASKGAGMGLATVHGLVHQHEGWIEVITAPGEGASFRVYLPASPLLAESAPLPVPTTRIADRPHTILVVEDEEAVRSLVKEVLLHHQYRVIEAENVADALRVWEQQRDEVDLLLTDLMMPGNASGLDLAQLLLADRADLRVIYTSGYSSELFANGVQLQEGRNYLPKPYLSSKLTSILRNALEPAEVEVNGER